MISKRVAQARVRAGLTSQTKRELHEANDWKCTRCGKPCPPDKFGKSELNTHHRRRIAKGGKNQWWNLQDLCKDCHQREHEFDKPIIVKGSADRFESDPRTPALQQEPRPVSNTPAPQQGDTGMNYGNNRNGGGQATRNQDDGSNYQVLDESELEWTASVTELHPAGWTRLELIKVEAFFDEESGKKKAKLIFHSDEELENGNPFPISCKTTTTFHPRANVTKFLVARGIDPQKLDPTKFKLSEYVKGGPHFGYVMGNITHEPRQDGAGMYAKIDSFAPMQKKKKRDEEAFVDESAAPPPPPAADPDREAKKRRALEDDDE